MPAFYITGIPGAGKSTIIAALKSHGLAAYDLDYVPNACIWRERNTLIPATRPANPTPEWLQTHEWVADKQLVQQIIDQHTDQPVFFGGMVGNQDELWPLFNQVFLLKATIKTIMERLQKRTDSDEFGANQVERQSILTWYQNFEQQTTAHGALVIDASQPAEQIVQELINVSYSHQLLA